MNSIDKFFSKPEVLKFWIFAFSMIAIMDFVKVLTATHVGVLVMNLFSLVFCFTIVIRAHQELKGRTIGLRRTYLISGIVTFTGIIYTFGLYVASRLS